MTQIDPDVMEAMEVAAPNQPEETAPKPVANLVRYEGGKPIIDDSNALKAYARIIWETPSMEISGARSPADVFMALAHGMEAGMSPTMCVRNVMVVNGKPAIWGDSLLGIIQSSGQLAGFDESIDDGELVASCRIVRLMPLVNGEFREIETVRTFGKSDAETAGLWGKRGPWSAYPKRMLQQRARGFAIRDAFADFLGGLSVADDLHGSFDPSLMRSAKGAAARLLDDDNETAVGGEG